MDNHYHLLLRTVHPNLSITMHYINTTYAGYINNRYERVGHLFQGRYKSILVDSNTYLLELSRYIHLQAVKNGIARRPAEYEWTSYKSYLHNEGFVYGDWLTDYFAENIKLARAEYQKFVEEKITDYNFDPFKTAYKNTILGNRDFITEVKKKIIDKKKISKEISSHSTLGELYAKEKILGEIKNYYKITNIELKLKGKKLEEYQYIGMYLLKKHTELSLNEIGEIFGGRHYSFVSRVYRNCKHDMQNASTSSALRKRIEYLERKIGLSTKSRPDPVR